MSTIYKCDRCGREMNKIHNRLKEVVIEGKSRFEGTKYFEPETLDLCEECYKDFKSFMFGPERDLDSKTILRPWSEVGEPPKINGCPLCESEDEKDTDRVYSIGSYVVSKSNRSRVLKITDIVKNDQGDVCYKLVGLDSKRTENTVTKNYLDSFYAIFYDPLSANDESDSDSDVFACEQCKFKDFSWDEEPCSTCKYSVMSVGDDQSDNFESKEEEERALDEDPSKKSFPEYCDNCKYKGTPIYESPCVHCIDHDEFEQKEEEDTGECTDADALSKAKYKIGSYIQSDIIKGSIYKIMDIRLRDDDEFVYKVEDSSSGIQNLLWERVIDNYYTVIVKYSCDGCKLEGTDDCMCDTCIVGDPKGPRRQWWKPKEEG